ncbi:MAG: FeoB-associated Cys-rich membrane protein [Clostridium sp.]
MATFLIGAVVIGAMIIISIRQVKKHSKGDGCGCGCSGCSQASKCHK